MNTFVDNLPKAWLFSDLPGYREPPQSATYYAFSYADLPPIGSEADEQFCWLQEEKSKPEWSLRDWDGEVGRRLTEIEGSAGISLPASFTAFLRSPDLQSRIRSCTACYLQMSDLTPPEIGAEGGHLVHFLSDQQWCLHWYLYLSQSGEECVICSEKAHGFEHSEDEEDFDPSAPIDLLKEGAVYCAPSFTGFMYRFWIENEIYFNVTGIVSLTVPQQAYLEHYRKQIKEAN